MWFINYSLLGHWVCSVEEKLEDHIGVVIHRTDKIQWQNEKEQKDNNDVQKITQKTKIEQYDPPPHLQQKQKTKTKTGG